MTDQSTTLKQNTSVATGGAGYGRQHFRRFIILFMFVYCAIYTNITVIFQQNNN